MDRIGKPLKRQYMPKDNALYRALSYLVFGNEKYYDQIIPYVEKYKALMEIEFNAMEIVSNDDLRAFAKLFAINILVYIDGIVSKWICYSAGEFFFKNMNQLKKVEYKTGKCK
uniref:Uncharacterized protein n=1 Tax=Panagrolaimus superbus TaxID=310955 RepID=A0A914Y1E5_9BILA